MIEECRNNKHDYYNKNETDASLDTTKNGKGIFPDITYPSMTEEFGNKKHNNNNEKETDASMYTTKKLE